MRIWVVSSSLIGILLASSASAQRSVLLVGVGDAETGLCIPDAEVSVRGVSTLARTDSLGRARIARLPAGIHTVTVRRIGYAPLSAPVKLADRDSVEAILLLRSSATELPAVTVVDTAPPFFLREFEERRKHAIGGRFIMREQIEQLRDYSVGNMLSVFVPSLRESTPGVLTYRHGCRPLFYWNGVLINDSSYMNINLKTHDIGGVEFYPSGFIPVQYKRAGSNPAIRNRRLVASGDPSCGALLIWPRP